MHEMAQATFTCCLTVYDKQLPAGIVIAKGTHSNPHVICGKSLTIAKSLSNSQ